jgi:hypothetical protein
LEIEKKTGSLVILEFLGQWDVVKGFKLMLRKEKGVEEKLPINKQSSKSKGY